MVALPRLHSHLVRYHPELCDKTTKNNTTATVNQPTLDDICKAKLPFSSPRANSITNSIAMFIGKDLRPYSVMENEGFRRMLKILEPRYEIPSRKYFTETAIPALYKETSEKVQIALESSERVALTCDSWMSRAKESYVTITVHFIDDKWEMNAYVLQTRAMHDSHTSAHMAEVLQRAAEEWSLTEKDPVVVTDNATNMTLAVELTGFQHIRSFAHILNLASQRALKLPAVARLIAKILRISVFFHRSTKVKSPLFI